MKINKIIAGVLSLCLIGGAAPVMCTAPSETAITANAENSGESSLLNIKCGMTYAETIDTFGTSDYTLSISKEDYNSYYVYKNISSPDFADVTLNALEFIEYSYPLGTNYTENGLVYTFGWHIGMVYDPQTGKNTYPYTEQELRSAYETLLNKLTEKLGEGDESGMGRTWHTENGDVWLYFSMDMFGAEGVNKIILSVSDISVLNNEKTTLYGDVNGDGVIDAADATLVLRQYSAESMQAESIIDDEQKLRANVNNDDTIDPRDATLILQYFSYKSMGGELGILDFISDLKQQN